MAAEKILGMWWCKATDELTFRLSKYLINCVHRPIKMKCYA